LYGVIQETLALDKDPFRCFGFFCAPGAISIVVVEVKPLVGTVLYMADEKDW
jgi:inorganic pyrophosphatase